MCLTQFEHLDCGPLWSSVSHNTDPWPAGSLVVYPVSLMGQSGCHPHPEGWKVRTSSYWYTCALKVCVSAHVWHTVQLKSRAPAVFVECLPLCPLTPTPADRDHHPLTLFNCHLKILLDEDASVYGVYQFVPLAALPEGCGRPTIGAKGGQCPGEEAQLDPRMGLYLWVMLLLTARLLPKKMKILIIELLVWKGLCFRKCWPS